MPNTYQELKNKILKKKKDSKASLNPPIHITEILAIWGAQELSLYPPLK